MGTGPNRVKGGNAMNENDVLDVAVIGAGPAGLTAGLYAARAGLSVAIYERISPGGQLAQTERVENYPGFAEGADGFELAWAMKEQAEHFGAIIVSEEVTAVDFSGEVKTLTTPFGQHKARSVIVATGARPRKMGLAGEELLAGRGVSYCATCDGNFFRGKSVCVLGGGNTAAADAKYLARICERVYLVHRRDTLRASAIDRERLSSLSNVEFVWNSRIADLHSEEGRLTAVEVEDVATGARRTLPVEGLFVAIGTIPNADFLEGVLPVDKGGYIVADESGATSVPGVFAAGDVRAKGLRQVVTAVSDGAIAAESAAAYVASR